MKNELRVSLITITYNSDKTLLDTIASVKKQTYPHIEYVVIDGGSKDGTLNIINDHREMIDVFISEPDKGIYDAMNKGINHCTGDVIGILNSDDLYEDENVMSDVMKNFNADNTLDMLYGDLLYVRNNDTSKIIRKWHSKKYTSRFFENGNVPAHPTLFLKKHVYEQAGLFNLKYRLAADYEFMLRVFKKHDFKSLYIQRWMVRMRLGGATNKNINNIKNGNLEIINAWKENELRRPPLLMIKRLIKRLKQFI